jgi:amidase
MAFAEYDRYDGLGLAELVRTKEVTAAELLDEAITRIDRVNPRINAIVYKLYERARKQVAEGVPDGPFAGVPFLIKDLLCALTGEPLQCGSRMYRDYRPTENSELVNRYLATGAVIAGKTNTPELGLTPVTEPVAFGPARNPWDTSRTTGGSSGGSGAAVAARIVPMAGGGDGGGSIRIPSSACGIFGLKPSRGRTPTGPFESEGWAGFAVEHVLTRSVRDSATMLDAVSGDYPGDFHGLPKPASPFADEVGKDPGKLRIAMATKPLLPSNVHPDCIKAVRDTAELLTELGHEVIEADPVFDGRAFSMAFLTIIAGQTSAGIRKAEKLTGRSAGRDDFEQRTWLTAQLGDAFRAGEYVTALGEVHAMAREIHRFTGDYDVILNPTLAMPPQPHGFLDAKGPLAILESILVRLPVAKLLKDGPVFEQTAADVFGFIPWTPVYNATGQPSMSVPLHWNDAGLPIGSMFTSKLRDEATLFRLAAQLEQARPWADKKPPVCG